MLPVLQVGPLALQTYPLALVLAGWVALTVAARAAERAGFDSDHIYNAGLYGLIGGVLAARFAHVLAFWPAYRLQPLEIFGFNTTAFLLGPGVVTALAVAGWYIYRRRLPLVPMLDAFAPGLLLGLGVAAVGAFLAGRSSGAAADLPWAITVWGVRRHPVQLYEAVGLLAIALFVFTMTGKQARPGAPFFTALLGWGLVMWLIEAFRSPEVSAALPGRIRLAQVIGLAAAVVALIGLRRVTTVPPRDENNTPFAP